MLNAANEVAVNAFLQARSFYRDCGDRRGNACNKVWRVIWRQLMRYYAVDRSARQQAHNLVAKGSVFKIEKLV